jgi:hypothetical protein
VRTEAIAESADRDVSGYSVGISDGGLMAAPVFLSQTRNEVIDTKVATVRVCDPLIGTFDFLADDLPFAEGAAFVRTVVINRVDLAIEVYERETLALHLNTDRTVFGNLRLLRDFDEGMCWSP